MKKILITIIMGILLIAPVMALDNQGTGKQNQNFTFVQVCNDATYITLDTILLPTKSALVISQNMTFVSGGTFHYNITNTSQLGRYDITGISDGCENSFATFITITKSGTLLETGESLTYFILAFGVFLLFVISFYFMIATPYGNEVNEKGAVIKITKLKYVKLALILLTWVLFTWFLNILIGLADNFVVLTMYYGFFGFIFQVMNNLALPLGILILVISFFEIIRDANILGNLKKFGSG